MHDAAGLALRHRLEHGNCPPDVDRGNTCRRGGLPLRAGRDRGHVDDRVDGIRSARAFNVRSLAHVADNNAMAAGRHVRDQLCWRRAIGEHDHGLARRGQMRADREPDEAGGASDKYGHAVPQPDVQARRSTLEGTVLHAAAEARPIAGFPGQGRRRGPVAGAVALLAHCRYDGFAADNYSR